MKLGANNTTDFDLGQEQFKVSICHSKVLMYSAKQVRVYDFATQETIKICQGSGVQRADLHYNGVITVVYQDNTLGIYRPFEVVNQIELGSFSPTAVLAFDDYVCVGQYSNQVTIYKRSKNNKCQFTKLCIIKVPSEVQCLTSLCGALYAQCKDQMVRVPIDAFKKYQNQRETIDIKNVFSMSYANGGSLAALHQDGSISLIDSQTLRITQRIECSKAGSVLHASSELHILQTKDEGIFVYKLNDLKEIEQLGSFFDSQPVVSAGAGGLSIYLLQQLFLGKYRAVELSMTNDQSLESQILSCNQPLKVTAMLNQSDFKNLGFVEQSLTVQGTKITDDLAKLLKEANEYSRDPNSAPQTQILNHFQGLLKRNKDLLVIYCALVQRKKLIALDNKLKTSQYRTMDLNELSSCQQEIERLEEMIAVLGALSIVVQTKLNCLVEPGSTLSQMLNTKLAQFEDIVALLDSNPNALQILQYLIIRQGLEAQIVSNDEFDAVRACVMYDDWFSGRIAIMQQDRLEKIVSQVVLAQYTEPIAILQNLLERKQYELAISTIQKLSIISRVVEKANSYLNLALQIYILNGRMSQWFVFLQRLESVVVQVDPQAYYKIVIISIEHLIKQQQFEVVLTSVLSFQQESAAGAYLQNEHPNLHYARLIWLKNPLSAVALGKSLNASMSSNDQDHFRRQSVEALQNLGSPLSADTRSKVKDSLCDFFFDISESSDEEDNRQSVKVSPREQESESVRGRMESGDQQDRMVLL